MGNVLESSYWSGKNNAIKIKKKYIRNNKTATKIIDQFTQKNGCKALCIKSEVGTGKTFALEYILDNHFRKFGSNTRVLLLSTRRGYAQDITNNTLDKLDFVNYMDIRVKETSNSYSRLVDSLESLHNLYNSDQMTYYDMVILDEIESISAQFFSETLENRHVCFGKLNDILKYSKKIVVMDADLDNRGMEFIKNITSDIQIIQNEYKDPPRKYTIVNDYTKYFDCIVDDIRNNRNVCIVSLCKNIALDLRDRLMITFPEMKDMIVCLHSESDALLKKEMDNIRKNWIKYKVLIYTSIVGAGINFDVPKHFFRIYGYIEGNLESPRVFLQMIGRIREPVERDCIVMLASKMNKNTDALLYSLKYAENHHRSIILKDYSDSNVSMYEDENDQLKVVRIAKQTIWNRMRAYYIQEKELNNQHDNFLTMLRIKIEEKGNIFETDYTTNVVKIDIKKNIDRILEQPNISNNEYSKLKKEKNGISESQQFIMTKVQMRNKLNICDTADESKLNECLKLYDRNKNTIERILNKYSIKNEFNDIDSYDGGKVTHLENAFNKVVEKLDYEFVNVAKEYDKYDFEKRMEKIKFNKGEIQSLGTRGKAIDNYEIIKMVLSRFGISLNAQLKKKQINGVRKKIIDKYKLCYDKSIYNIIYCIASQKNNYQHKFASFIEKYNEHYDLLKEHIKKKRTGVT
jgi:hypothetical protein